MFSLVAGTRANLVGQFFKSKNLKDEIAAFFPEACVYKCQLHSERLIVLNTKETILIAGWIQPQDF